MESGLDELIRSSAHRVGLISDTHGLLRPEVFAAFKGVDLILHAGDVGPDELLDELATIAPLYAVRGNTDAVGNPRLPDSLELEITGVTVHLSHGHEIGATPDRLFAAYEADVIVYGHTHRELVTRASGRVAVNPGAAGARRFDLMPCVGLMTIEKGEVEIELVKLL
jgi:putative phosphoesterase